MSSSFCLRPFRVAVLCAWLTLTIAVASPDEPAAPSPKTAWSVRVIPTRLVNGSPVFFQVTPPEPLKSLTATWLGRQVSFERGRGKIWFALAGISLETHAGSFPLVLGGTTESGASLTFQRDLMIGRAKYPVIQLSVSKQFTAPNPEQQEKIKQDQEIKRTTFSQTSPELEWSGRFAAPVDAPISDVFGTRRVFNGQTKSVHQGLDYRVPPATPVLAANRGTVLLAQPLYFEGDCVVLDHGQGLLTLYMHLSELKVKAGEQVQRGQLIGLSGATGRATGPHLHMAVRWQGIYLDPAALLTLPLPELSPPGPAGAN
jgi:Peptidase family M23